MNRKLNSSQGDIVILQAFVAKPKVQSVASHSPCALYETSLLTFKIPIGTHWPSLNVNGTTVEGRDCRFKQPESPADFLPRNDGLMELLQNMNNNLEVDCMKLQL